MDYHFKTFSDDFDPKLSQTELVELGVSKEVITNELYLPCHKSRDWIRCCITITQPDCYR